MTYVRQNNYWFRALTFILMLHLFNYSVNMEDHRLLNEVGVSDESNEIETLTELLLTLAFDDIGALPDEANDIDETKGIPGIIAVIPSVDSLKNSILFIPVSGSSLPYLNNYLSQVNEINSPPPKKQV